MKIVKLGKVRRRRGDGDSYVTEGYYVPIPKELGEKMEKAGIEYLVVKPLESGEILLKPLSPEALGKMLEKR